MGLFQQPVRECFQTSDRGITKRIPPTAKSTCAVPADRLYRQFQQLLIAAFPARDQRAPEGHRTGVEPEPHQQNFAIGEIPLVVALALLGHL